MTTKVDPKVSSVANTYCVVPPNELSTMEKYLERFTRVFWREAALVDEKGCWLWTRYKNPWNHYGQVFLKIGTKTYSAKAHRLSYRIHHGQIPDGLHVIHTCDNPCCYNPEHLKTGTHAENMADRVAKGRSPQGSKCPSAKLTEAKVLEIKEKLARKVRTVDLCKEYGVGHTTILNIKNNKMWKHILTSQNLKGTR